MSKYKGYYDPFFLSDFCFVEKYNRVTSYEFKSTRYEIKSVSCEFKSTSYEFKSTS